MQKQILNLEAIYPENIQDTLDTLGVPDDIILMMPDWMIVQVG